MAEVAIVTGHGSGIGKAFSDRLQGSGVVVVGVSRRLVKESNNLIQVPGSVADQKTVDAAFNAAQGAGDLKIVINSAGRGVFGTVGSYSVQDIQNALEGNLIGLIAFTDRAVTVMGANGGDIVNIMSTASKKLRPAESVYTAAKWGAKAYTRTVREAIKAAKLPIRIFEVYPCGMKTRFWLEAVRPITDGNSFPSPDPIAEIVLRGIKTKVDSYQQEFTFERS